jgi:hypothetical protein
LFQAWSFLAWSFQAWSFQAWSFLAWSFLAQSVYLLVLHVWNNSHMLVQVERNAMSSIYLGNAMSSIYL